MEKSIIYKDRTIKIVVTLNGHTETKIDYNAGRFDDPYTTKILHLFECFVDNKLIGSKIGNDYDLSMQIPEFELIKSGEKYIDNNQFEQKPDNIDILKNLGYK